MIAHYRCGLRDKPHGPHRFRAFIGNAVIHMFCGGNTHA